MNIYKELITKINKKVLIISHNDLDGAGCVLIAKRVFTNVDFVNLNINELDEYLNKLISPYSYRVKKEKGNIKGYTFNSCNYDYVFITDFYVQIMKV